LELNLPQYLLSHDMPRFSRDDPFEPACLADNGLTYLAGVGQVVRRMIPILHLPAILSVTERTQLLAALAEQPEIGENS
jgi:hypothetical protein